MLLLRCAVPCRAVPEWKVVERKCIRCRELARLLRFKCLRLQYCLVAGCWHWPACGSRLAESVNQRWVSRTRLRILAIWQNWKCIHNTKRHHSWLDENDSFTMIDVSLTLIEWQGTTWNDLSLHPDQIPAFTISRQTEKQSNFPLLLKDTRHSRCLWRNVHCSSSCQFQWQHLHSAVSPQTFHILIETVLEK